MSDFLDIFKVLSEPLHSKSCYVKRNLFIHKNMSCPLCILETPICYGIDFCSFPFSLLQGGTTNDDNKGDDKSKDENPETFGFSQVFGLVAFGAVVVAFNSKLLGGSL